MKQPCVCIVASRRHGTLYTGVTSNLPKRAFEHREGLVSGFSKKYGCKMLVWYELHESMIEAITREKQIKAGSRARKLALIEALNPEWIDLYESLAGDRPRTYPRHCEERSDEAIHRPARRKEWIASLRSQ
jgi:putative endonuclease